MLHSQQKVTQALQGVKWLVMHVADDQQTADMWAALTRETWRARLRGVQRNVEVSRAVNPDDLAVCSTWTPQGSGAGLCSRAVEICRRYARVNCLQQMPDRACWDVRHNWRQPDSGCFVTPGATGWFV